MFTILYFSPTGNGKFIAETLAEKLGDLGSKPLAMEKQNPKDLKSSEHLVLIFPIHGFNPPRTVKRFLAQLPPGLYEKVSLIAVGCTTAWINEGASGALRVLLEGKDYTIHLDEVMEMPLTFVTEFPEDRTKAILEALPRKIEILASQLKGKSQNRKSVGIFPKLLSFLGQGESLAARLFGLELHATKDCSSCGLCWENCPEKNIKPNLEKRPRFGLDCLMCMRCIYNCPEKAITPYLSKFLPIKNGYRLKDKMELG